MCILLIQSDVYVWITLNLERIFCRTLLFWMALIPFHLISITTFCVPILQVLYRLSSLCILRISLLKIFCVPYRDSSYKTSKYHFSGYLGIRNYRKHKIYGCSKGSYKSDANRTSCYNIWLCNNCYIHFA